MAWFRFHKSFQGGSTTAYVWIDLRTAKKIFGSFKSAVSEIGEKWAEGTSGGHCYGYDFSVSRIKIPPLSYLESMESNISSEMAGYEAKIRDLSRKQGDRERMKYFLLKEMLKAKKPKRSSRVKASRVHLEKGNSYFRGRTFWI